MAETKEELQRKIDDMSLHPEIREQARKKLFELNRPKDKDQPPSP